ncbi:E3 ubiquitin-protein ligase wwp-1-like [Artemia franciscana]|uniref:HECT-type E3 ubiquitin transferase n=1 Tax=Artemia franciscana TaxID=6661 RepID=A0AA88HSU4_ARTSF|nr:hypothetical protein QYM36_009956 [Artemia franciscana]
MHKTQVCAALMLQETPCDEKFEIGFYLGGGAGENEFSVTLSSDVDSVKLTRNPTFVEATLSTIFDVTIEKNGFEIWQNFTVGCLVCLGRVLSCPYQFSLQLPENDPILEIRAQISDVSKLVRKFYIYKLNFNCKSQLGWFQEDLLVSRGLFKHIFIHKECFNLPAILDQSLGILGNSPNKGRLHEYMSLRKTLDICISRKNIEHSSFKVLMIQEHNGDFVKPLVVHFRGEIGEDISGLKREWLIELCNRITNPSFGLFQFADQLGSELCINKNCKAKSNHLQWFRFLGRVIALSVIHDCPCFPAFTKIFYKQFMSQEIEWSDLEYDKQFLQNLYFIKENDVDDLGLQFTVEEADDRYCKEMGLIEDGRFINVTNDNKKFYCDSMFSWKAGTSFIEEINGIIGGFNDVIPYELLSNSTAKQLKDSLVGLQNIDVKEWKDCTTYSDYKPDDKTITLFWEFVFSLGENDKRQLLKFWTGYENLPIGGFGSFSVVHYPGELEISRLEEDGLPESHVCSLSLQLPPYTNMETLAKRVRFAMNETKNFGKW